MATANIRDPFMENISPDSHFYRLFDYIPGVSFFAKDRSFRLVAANQQFVERFGFQSEADVIGKNDFDLFPPQLAVNFRRDDEEVFFSGEPKLQIIELFFGRQGIPDWFITNKLPVRDKAGQVIGVMGTVQSYEGRKEALQSYLTIDKAVAYIRQHFRERITVEHLASVAHLSTRQLHRKFIESFGLSPQSFIMKLRIQTACETLQDGRQPIAEVARELGFYDQSIFTQHFQKHMGLTPFRYQQQFRPDGRTASKSKK